MTRLMTPFLRHGEPAAERVELHAAGTLAASTAVARNGDGADAASGPCDMD